MTIVGIDYLGGANYIDTVVTSHPEGSAAGFLMKCTGWRNGMLAGRALAQSNKCKDMRFHGLWLDNHAFDCSHIAPAVSQAKKVAKLKEKFTEITMFYSPWLEANCTLAVARECRKQCRAVLPKEIKIVGPGNKLKRGIQEVHHQFCTPAKYIFSLDGADMLSEGMPIQTFKRTHVDSIYFFLWGPPCNGLKSLTDKTPRSERTHWLTKKTINRMIKKYKGA